MGRRKNSESEVDSSESSSKCETLSVSSDLDSPPRKKLKKKYKKSHKYKMSESEYSEEEYECLERKKHKHKHKKHKSHKHRSEHYEEAESYRHHKRRHSHHSSTHETRNKHHRYSSEAENRNRRSSHRKRDKHRNPDDYANRDMDREVENEQQRSRWYHSEENDSHLLRPIKNELVSDSNDEEPNRNHSRNNRNNEERRERRDRNEKWGRDATVKKEENEPKQTVNFGLSGKLTEDTNTYNGVVIKYSQPPEARKPKRRWRWYIFKGDEELPYLPLHRQSAYLIGRERKVADIPTDHPSCSKQHAVFQYRLVSYQREDSTVGRTVKPYILDLESANGTYVNNRRIDPRRYVELLEKDVVKFGYSSREYVLLHEASKGSEDEIPDAGTDLSPISLLRTT